MAEKPRPIYVIKKKGGHGGHHGGAWKVAYADFVTAMMSLFIVLWLMSSSSKVKEAVAGYFNDPKGSGKLLGTTMSGKGESPTPPSTETLEKLKEKIEEEIKARKDLQKLSKQIEITITPEGLRIELIEGKDGTFYELGSPKLSQNGQELLTLLATQLKTMPNVLLLEGYTDATPYSSDNSYSNWDLSVDRANSARRVLQQAGVRPTQVKQVRGYADQMLRVKNNPTDPSNRRVSILVKNETEVVPLFSAEKIVSGATPLPGSAQDPHAKEPEAKPASGSKESAAAKEGEAKPAAETKPAAPSPTEAEAKQAAAPPAAKPSAPGPAAPTAKPSLMDRLKGMLPGHKTTPPAASSPATAAPAPAAAPPAKASAATSATSPAAQPSLLDRLKAMLPGHKK
jgi:chemotaxis protein MotB